MGELVEFPTPQSRELRLHSGETDDVETLLLKVQGGGHKELIDAIVAVELTGELRFSEGVRALGHHLCLLLQKDGYVVTATILEAQRAVLEAYNFDDEPEAA